MGNTRQLRGDGVGRVWGGGAGSGRADSGRSPWSLTGRRKDWKNLLREIKAGSPVAGPVEPTRCGIECNSDARGERFERGLFRSGRDSSGSSPAAGCRGEFVGGLQARPGVLVRADPGPGSCFLPLEDPGRILPWVGRKVPIPAHGIDCTGCIRREAAGPRELCQSEGPGYDRPGTRGCFLAERNEESSEGHPHRPSDFDVSGGLDLGRVFPASVGPASPPGHEVTPASCCYRPRAGGAFRSRSEPGLRCPMPWVSGCEGCAAEFARA